MLGPQVVEGPLANTSPFTFLVGTPEGGVIVSDLTELRRMLR